jgi:hypothetical protein
MSSRWGFSFWDALHSRDEGGLSSPPHVAVMHRKIRADAPSLAELHAAVELAPVDRRKGSWSKLELIAMNERFAWAMARAPVPLWRARPRGGGIAKTARHPAR